MTFANNMPKILTFAGSYREHSYNKRVLAVAAEGARAAGAEVTTIDLRDYPMPIFCADGIENGEFDANALRLQELMAEHDGFLIASPEYNGSIPGGLKNAIDWTSRANERYKMYEPVKGKTVAIISAAPGQFGGVRMLPHLRAVFATMGVHVLSMEIAVPFVGQKFDGDSTEMTDEKTRSVLHSLGASLVEKIK
ncbi:MAG: NAD(P)H-dependent oxidoreductase [Blastocatellia bacterium]|nr:NAD(P)H-dependent oxidoreductase [Blastocatellia bacterium]